MTPESLRKATEQLIALAPQSKAYSDSIRTVVGVDECVAYPALQEGLTRCLAVGAVLMVRMFWQELRETSSGEMIVTGGGSPRGKSETGDWGHRIVGDSWPDTRVVQFAIMSLYTNRRVVLLSADRRGNVDGLKTLLHQQIKPVLNRAPRDHGLSLVLLLQRPRTQPAGYAARVEKYLVKAAFLPGFQGVLL